jgi:hypothetical protein
MHSDVAQGGDMLAHITLQVQDADHLPHGG